MGTTGMMHGGWACGPLGFMGGPWAGIGNLVFWGAIAALAVWAVVRFTRSRETAGPRDSALEVLKRRYAAGEIDREEYERVRHTLDG